MAVDGGPRVVGAVTEFMRLVPGARIPTHRHLGEERFFIVQGRAEDSDGTTLRRGRQYVFAAGSAHALEIRDSIDCIFAMVLENGIRLE